MLKSIMIVLLLLVSTSCTHKYIKKEMTDFEKANAECELFAESSTNEPLLLASPGLALLVHGMKHNNLKKQCMASKGWIE